METNETSLMARIRARRIFQWAFAYVAGAWVLLELTDFLSELYGWPEVVVRFLLTAFAFGLLATLVVAWFHGAPGRQRAPRTEVVLLVLLALVGAGTSLRVLAGGVGDEAAGPLAGSFGGVGLTRAALAETRIPDPREASLSLVVLPFASLDGGVDEGLSFADGVTEDILFELSLLPGLRVISRTTAMRYRDAPMTLVEIGRELGVDLVVEGTVRRAGDQARIVVQLVDARTDEHLWAGSYDREVEDLLAVQAEVAEAVARELSQALGLAPEETRRFAGRPAHVDPEAYRRFLEGRRLARSEDPVQVEAGAELLARAVELDPRIESAWRALGDLLERTDGASDTTLVRVRSFVRGQATAAVTEGPNPFAVAPDPARAGTVRFESAQAGAGQAGAVQPGDAEATVPPTSGPATSRWRFLVHRTDLDAGALEGAETALVEALVSTPNDADARRWYGLYGKRLT